MSSKEVIPDKDLEILFLGTNFGVNGDVDKHRKILETSVLKKTMGYHCGYTITQIMLKSKLIGKNGNLLKRGRKFLAASYGHLIINCGG